MVYAPIVCFGFDRPHHLENMLTSLEMNSESSESDVYICIDGPSEKTDISLHEQTKNVAKKNWRFKSTTLIFRENNLDCRTNIITTISELFESHEELIILEDDLELGKNFLKFMNDSLEKYKDSNNVWHVNGYAYPQLNFKKRASIGRYISPWGWATWKDKWDIFVKKDYDKTNMISQLSDEERNKFNVEKLYDWENIIIKNEIGEISAWDAYWYQAVFLNDGYSIYPNKSHIKNKGFDGTGMHCSNNDDWKTPLNSSQTNHFPNNISETKLFRFNTLLFYRYYNFKRYLRFHKSKIESFENFRNFLRKKLSI